jgi:quinol monooxygenase YgiN
MARRGCDSLCIVNPADYWPPYKGGIMSTAVSVIATFIPKSGQDKGVEQVLRGMVAPTRKEPGCDRYDLYCTKDSPPSYVLFEIYKDQAALEAHRGTEHYKSYRARIPELLNEPIKVQVLNGVDVSK